MSAIVFSSADKAKAVARELGMRRRVYPRRVALEKISQAKSDLEIAIFQAIYEDYIKQAEAERLTPNKQRNTP